jgi:hypothetical protein
MISEISLYGWLTALVRACREAIHMEARTCCKRGYSPHGSQKEKRALYMSLRGMSNVLSLKEVIEDANYI